MDAQNATLYYLEAFREAGDIADELVDIAGVTEAETPAGEETDEAARHKLLMGRLEDMLRKWNDHYSKLGSPDVHTLGDKYLRLPRRTGSSDLDAIAAGNRTSAVGGNRG